MDCFPPRLIDGYRTFTSQRLPTEQSRYRELSERGQSPEVMVIGCCDSRVSPEVIFDAGPGELFVVRNVANLVPVYQPDAGAHVEQGRLSLHGAYFGVAEGSLFVLDREAKEFRGVRESA